jgi:hypothetical protein
MPSLTTGFSGVGVCAGAAPASAIELKSTKAMLRNMDILPSYSPIVLAFARILAARH